MMKYSCNFAAVGVFFSEIRRSCVNIRDDVFRFPRGINSQHIFANFSNVFCYLDVNIVVVAVRIVSFNLQDTNSFGVSTESNSNEYAICSHCT